MEVLFNHGFDPPKWGGGDKWYDAHPTLLRVGGGGGNVTPSPACWCPCHMQLHEEYCTAHKSHMFYSVYLFLWACAPFTSLVVMVDFPSKIPVHFPYSLVFILSSYIIFLLSCNLLSIFCLSCHLLSFIYFYFGGSCHLLSDFPFCHHLSDNLIQMPKVIKKQYWHITFWNIHSCGKVLATSSFMTSTLFSLLAAWTGGGKK